MQSLNKTFPNLNDVWAFMCPWIVAGNFSLLINNIRYTMYREEGDWYASFANTYQFKVKVKAQ